VKNVSTKTWPGLRVPPEPLGVDPLDATATTPRRRASARPERRRRPGPPLDVRDGSPSVLVTA
jgi:hypothetical protein